MDPSRVINWDITPDVANFARLQSMAVEHKINLVVPGPELPLVNGITSVFHSVGIPVFGPSVKAAPFYVCIHTVMQCRGRGLAVALPHGQGEQGVFAFRPGIILILFLFTEHVIRLLGSLD